MFTTLETLLRYIDQTVVRIADQYHDEINCKPGCADCCHAVFDISFIEAAYIAAYLKQHPHILAEQQELAQQAAEAWEALCREQGDPATARIRCPLLDDSNLCRAHEVRPINCRTYGTPTVINGKGHVCGFSGFKHQGTYPTVDLAPLQQQLADYSAALAGESFRIRRFPIAWIFLRLHYFLPPR